MRNKTTYWRFKPWVVVLFLALYTLSICGITAAATWVIVTSVNSSSTRTVNKRGGGRRTTTEIYTLSLHDALPI